MFAEVQQGHAQKQAALREKSDKAKREALGAVADLAGLLVDKVNGGVHKIFLQEKGIEAEVRQLTATVQKFAKQHAQWTAMFAAFDDALKELGDFENWIKVTDYDLQIVGGTLKTIAANTPEKKL